MISVVGVLKGLLQMHFMTEHVNNSALKGYLAYVLNERVEYITIIKTHII